MRKVIILAMVSMLLVVPTVASAFTLLELMITAALVNQPLLLEEVQENQVILEQNAAILEEIQMMLLTECCLCDSDESDD